MTRIPGRTIADASAAARPLLEGVAQFSPTGKPLNLHAQMAHSPAVLAAYTGIRQATAAYGTLPPQVRSALMLATAGQTGQVSDPTWRQATASGWTSEELAEAFAYLGLTIFTAYFLNYAQTPLDLPVGVPAASQQG